MLIQSSIFTEKEQKELCRHYAQRRCKDYKLFITPVFCSLSVIREADGKQVRRYYYVTDARETDAGLLVYGVDEELSPIRFFLGSFEATEKNVKVQYYGGGWKLGDIYRLQYFAYSQTTGKGEEEFYNYILSQEEKDLLEKRIELFNVRLYTPVGADKEIYRNMLRAFYKWLKVNDKSFTYFDMYNEGQDYYEYLRFTESEERAKEIIDFIFCYIRYLNNDEYYNNLGRDYKLLRYSFVDLVNQVAKDEEIGVLSVVQNIQSALVDEYLRDSPDQSARATKEKLTKYYKWKVEEGQDNPFLYFEKLRNEGAKAKTIDTLISYFIWLSNRPKTAYKDR